MSNQVRTKEENESELLERAKLLFASFKSTRIELPLIFRDYSDIENEIKSLQRSKPLTFPTVANGLSFPNHNTFRIHASASAIQKGYRIRYQPITSTHPITGMNQISSKQFKLYCSRRSLSEHKGGLKCYFEMIIIRKNGDSGDWIVGEEINQHSEDCCGNLITKGILIKKVQVDEDLPIIHYTRRTSTIINPSSSSSILKDNSDSSPSNSSNSSSSSRLRLITSPRNYPSTSTPSPSSSSPSSTSSSLKRSYSSSSSTSYTSSNSSFTPSPTSSTSKSSSSIRELRPVSGIKPHYTYSKSGIKVDAWSPTTPFQSTPLSSDFSEEQEKIPSSPSTSPSASKRIKVLNPTGTSSSKYSGEVEILVRAKPVIVKRAGGSSGRSLRSGDRKLRSSRIV